MITIYRKIGFTSILIWLFVVVNVSAMGLRPLPYAAGENVFFPNNENQRLHALLFKAEDTKAVLISIHGMQSHAGWFFSGPRLSESGISTLAYDRRGSGLSEGIKGDASSPEDFLYDLGAAIAYAKQVFPGASIHLHANCFGIRIAIPYIAKFDPLKEIKSVILTAPGTNMSPAADYSQAERLCIRGFATGVQSPECSHLIASPGYLFTPLEDELFVSQGLWLDRFVRTDTLALRSVTPNFLMSAGALTLGMSQVLQQGAFVTPMLVILGRDDKMVDNAGIIRDLVTPHLGPKQVLELPCEHGLEFCAPEGLELYRKTMIDWILN